MFPAVYRADPVHRSRNGPIRRGSSFDVVRHDADTNEQQRNDENRTHKKTGEVRGGVRGGRAAYEAGSAMTGDDEKCDRMVRPSEDYATWVPLAGNCATEP
jgi:hypothetical protein